MTDFILHMGGKVHDKFHSSIPSCFTFLEAAEDVLFSHDVAYITESKMFSIIFDECSSG